MLQAKKNIVGILVDPTDYREATNFIISSAHAKESVSVSALAVHGVMTGVLDTEHKYRLNNFDLLVPDGQPVRWALNLLHGTRLTHRVYGPTLTLRVCEAAAQNGLSLYLYGSTPEILQALKTSLSKKFPALKIAGAEPSKFRKLTATERTELVDRIHNSGASILLLGLGCPRQEVFAYEVKRSLNMPVLAVGAAFPFIAGRIPQAPPWMQKRGLEWLFRLAAEPKRLWRRYLYLNPTYLLLVALQVSKIRFSTKGKQPCEDHLYG